GTDVWDVQDRLPKELKLAGIYDIEAANRFIREVYLPAHNARFAKPPQIAESGFVAANAAMLAEILCIEIDRVVARDNTVSHNGRSLAAAGEPAAGPLCEGQYQSAGVSGRDAGGIPRAAADRALRRRGCGASRPDRGQPDAVLATVKAWPGGGRVCG